MKKMRFCLRLILALLILAGCGSKSPQKLVTEDLGIDASGGKEVIHTDDHGGFHGDGTRYIVLSDEEGTILEEILRDNRWATTPLNEVSEVLAYGKNMPDGYPYGPILTGENQSLLIPKIEKGYYLLIDRQHNNTEDILSRCSYNLTFAIYDLVGQKLYYVKLDT